MTLTYRGTAYQTPSTPDASAPASIDCQYRGITYRIQPTCSTQPHHHHLQYRGVAY